MKETEITVEVLDTLENVMQILSNQGFLLIKERNMYDWYYSKSSIQDIKSMAYPEMIANSFLVRRIVDDKDLKMLTFKKKELDNVGNVIAEEKVECKLENIDSALEIFDAAGLTCWANIHQRMLIYGKGNVEFAVQIVDGLGIFIEYEEDESMAGMDEYAKIELMASTLDQIGLKLGSDLSCKKVYLQFAKKYDSK